MNEPKLDSGRVILRHAAWSLGLTVGLAIWVYSGVLAIAVLRRVSAGSTPTADPNLSFFMISLVSLFAFLAAVLITRTNLNRRAQKRVLAGAALTTAVFLIATAADLLTGDHTAFLAKLEQFLRLLGNIFASMS